MKERKCATTSVRIARPGNRKLKTFAFFDCDRSVDGSAACRPILVWRSEVLRLESDSPIFSTREKRFHLRHYAIFEANNRNGSCKKVDLGGTPLPQFVTACQPSHTAEVQCSTGFTHIGPARALQASNCPVRAVHEKRKCQAIRGRPLPDGGTEPIVECLHLLPTYQNGSQLEGQHSMLIYTYLARLELTFRTRCQLAY